LNHFDYILCGGGCAGLSLATHLINSERFSKKKILLLDKAPKTENDRTWCFWEQEPGPFEKIVARQWRRLWFYGDNYTQLLDIDPWRYKMIRGIDFYDYTQHLISRQPNIQVRYGNIESLQSDEAATQVIFDGEKITADYIFNSIPPVPDAADGNYHLLQHFKGWLIETPEPFFNPDEATLMDFRVSQQHGTTFVYVMPLTATQALVEYTLFTGSLLQQNEYDAALKNYIADFLQLKNYSIAEEEFGVIPMTSRRFAPWQNNIINMGTAGGQTKASSGYTFQFIQRHSAAIVQSLRRHGHPFVQTSRWQNRFRLYDNTLLGILHRGTSGGKTIFTDLFRKNKAAHILQFLDNSSNLKQELRIMNSVSKKIFIPAALREMRRL
jgi:lycopene beta-cyclase